MKRLLLGILCSASIAGCGPGSVNLSAPGALISNGPSAKPASPKPTSIATFAPTATPAGTPSPSASTGADTIDADLVTVRAVEAYYATLDPTDAIDDATSVATFMATQPQVAVAGSSDTFAIAEFSDGVSYTIDTLYSNSDAAGVPPPDISRARAATASAATRRAIPRSLAMPPSNVQIAQSTAYVFSNPTAFVDSTPEEGIGSALETAGFTTVSEPLTLANLQSVRGASIFYINTHGHSFGNLPGDYQGQATQGPAFAIGLADQWDPNGPIPQPYRGLLETGGTSKPFARTARLSAAAPRPNGIFPVKQAVLDIPNELTLLTAWQLDAAGNPVKKVHLYSATQTFFSLETEITFAPNALAFFDTCWSDDYSNFGVRSLIATLKSRGVASYLGFTKSADYLASNETANFLFDRWLGEQKPAASGAIQQPPAKETPAERPFTLDDILTYAQSYTHVTGYNKGLAEYVACNLYNNNETHPAAGCSVLDDASDANGGTPLLNPQTLLAPSADTFSIDETQATPQIAITGTFPSQTGSVVISTSPTSTAGGYSAPIQSWTSSSIVAEIPPAGMGSAGYVYVVSNGIASNPIPLTEWLGTLNYTYVPTPFNFDNGPAANQSVSGNLEATAAITTLLRDDVHRSRSAPGATPKQTGMKLKFATAGTTLDFNATGTDSGELCNGSIGDEPQCESVSDSWTPEVTSVPNSFSTSAYDPTASQVSIPASFCQLTDNGPEYICLTSNFGINPGIVDAGSGGETIGYMNCDSINVNDSTLIPLTYDATFTIAPGSAQSGDSNIFCAGQMGAANHRRAKVKKRADSGAADGADYTYGFRTQYAPTADTPG